MEELIWKKTVIFFSQGDENAFFAWLQGIKGVESVCGSGDGLHIGLESQAFSKEALRELIAIYRRYGGDLKELAAFLSPDNESWFKDPEAYWYRWVFGK